MAAESVIESLELNNLRGIDVLVKADPDEDGNLTEGKLSGTGEGFGFGKEGGTPRANERATVWDNSQVHNRESLIHLIQQKTHAGALCGLWTDGRMMWLGWSTNTGLPSPHPSISLIVVNILFLSESATEGGFCFVGVTVTHSSPLSLHTMDGAGDRRFI